MRITFTHSAVLSSYFVAINQIQLLNFMKSSTSKRMQNCWLKRMHNNPSAIILFKWAFMPVSTKSKHSSVFMEKELNSFLFLAWYWIERCIKKVPQTFSKEKLYRCVDVAKFWFFFVFSFCNRKKSKLKVLVCAILHHNPHLFSLSSTFTVNFCSWK